MSSILYYSNYCEPSKNLLQHVTKTNCARDIHFVCIDKRVKESNGKTFILLPTGQKIIMPENVTRVPALMLLDKNYQVIYGNDIYNYLKPQQLQQIKQATQNNMEPINHQDGFSAFSGWGNGVVSDNYSFLDQTGDELSVIGNGGLRQTHNYALLNDQNQNNFMNTPQLDDKNHKLKDGEITIDNLMQKRQEELTSIQNSMTRYT